MTRVSSVHSTKEPAEDGLGMQGPWPGNSLATRRHRLWLLCALELFALALFPFFHEDPSTPAHSPAQIVENTKVDEKFLGGQQSDGPQRHSLSQRWGPGWNRDARKKGVHPHPAAGVHTARVCTGTKLQHGRWQGWWTLPKPRLPGTWTGGDPEFSCLHSSHHTPRAVTGDCLSWCS